MQREAIEAGVAAVASKSTYFGAGSTVVGWLLSNEFALIFGMLIAMAGLVVNWYYRVKADRRGQEEHVLRMQRLAEGRRTDTDIGALE